MQFPILRSPEIGSTDPVPFATSQGVLLVDDDTALRAQMRDFLASAGLQVLEARNAYDALFLCAQYGDRLHVLLTEINLLPVGGVKLAENVLRLWPKVKVICMSEACDAPGVAYWMRYLDAQFLRKPFTPLELHGCVQAALGRTGEETDLPLPEALPRATGSQFWEHDPAAAASDRSNSRDPTFWLQEF